MQTIEISAENAGRRLDKFLFQYFNEAPHSFIYKMLRKKRIKLNGARAQGGELLQAGDSLAMYLSPETIAAFRKARVAEKAGRLRDIVYEDQHLLVVNKPVGMPSHGGMSRAGDKNGDKNNEHLLAQVLYYLQESGAYDPSAAFVPALCNRLDVNTGGLVICGKTIHALQEMNALFANRGVDKEYLAVADGVLGEAGENCLLEGLYRKDTRNNTAVIFPRKTLAPTPDIRHISGPDISAVTEYKVLAVSYDRKHTLVSVNPVTWRSHQIRAHLASIGYPLSGDKKYGGKPISCAAAQLLHCHRLSISHSKSLASLQYLAGKTWEASLPEGFARFVEENFPK